MVLSLRAGCGCELADGFRYVGKGEAADDFFHAVGNLPVAEVSDTALVGMAERA